MVQLEKQSPGTDVTAQGGMEALSAIAVNARFLNRRVTGVERYAGEVLKRFVSPVRTLRPRGNLQGLPGHAWEQFVLPYRTGKRLLWSPCNTGPLVSTRQVITIHDIIALDHPEWYGRRFSAFYDALLPRLARRAQHLIAVSEFTKGRVVERLGINADKVTVIPNGVGEEFVPQPASEIKRVRHELGLLDRPYVLSVCSLEPRKNLSRLLEAWENLPPSYDHFTLVIAGARSMAHSEINLNKHLKRTIFTNYVADADLPGLYSGASCFVYPSLYEGFGLPILEALACGVPVVASNCTSIPEVTGSSAIVVDPLSIADIASGIKSALDSPNGSGLERQAHARQYTWSRCAASTEALLLSLC